MEASLESNPWPKAGIFSGIAACTLLFGALFVYNGIKPAPVDEPKAFADFKATDGTFRCQYPQGWRKRMFNAQAVASGGVFDKGAARISATADLQGSLMGDISKSPGAGIEIPDNLARSAGLQGAVAELKKPAVEKVHEAEGKEAETKLDVSGYKENGTKPFTSRLGEGRYSEFTGDAGFPKGAMHGYRATILGTDRAIYVYCSCPEGDWPRLNKAFLRVIGSVSPGQ